MLSKALKELSDYEFLNQNVDDFITYAVMSKKSRFMAISYDAFYNKVIRDKKEIINSVNLRLKIPLKISNGSSTKKI